MARASEISDEGRIDLRQAIARFGGTDHICNITGLVPYKEWRYFESQLELFIEIFSYMKEHSRKTDITEGKRFEFPRLTDIQKNGHERLHNLIMDFGGRKLTAVILDMEYQTQMKDEIFQGLSLGRFDTEFVIRLMIYMRRKMMKFDCHDLADKNISASICMPTIAELLADGESKLAEGVEKYGGYESIARRLQFNFNETEAMMDAIRIQELSEASREI